MSAKSGDTSLFSAVLQLHQTRTWQAFIYSTTLILTTSTALVLDLRFHWPSERVLLYILPLSIVLLVLVPTLVVILDRANSKYDRDVKPHPYTSGFVSRTLMANPVRTLAQQFVRTTPGTLLWVATVISLADFAMLYAAASREGVLRISDGIGLLSNYGLFSTTLGNAVLPYAAKKYYDSVCSIRTSEAIVKSEPIERSIALLRNMVQLRERYRFLIYLLLTLGGLVWLSNLSAYLIGNPEIRWGHKVFDSVDHPLTFYVSRIHGFYTWLIVLPVVGQVLHCSCGGPLQWLPTKGR